MITIRELFHNLGNKHNIVTVGCGVTKEMVEECLESDGLSEALKENLLGIRKNIEQIIKGAMNADKITVEIQDRVYAVINPDNSEQGSGLNIQQIP